MEVDRARAEAIAKEIMRAVIANFQQGPSHPDRCFEALNACAFAVATVIVGTGDRAGRKAARTFFDQALEQNVAELIKNPPPPVGHA